METPDFEKNFEKMIDSLKRIRESEHNDSEKIDLLFQFMEQHVLPGMQFITKAISVTTEILAAKNQESEFLKELAEVVTIHKGMLHDNIGSMGNIINFINTATRLQNTTTENFRTIWNRFNEMDKEINTFKNSV